ncbi:hypothetical protein [Calidithermus timidus]|jgi:hypothetical protein|uniref:hypothetical protein n=1 Tax=Calidithermus timidus TaxID=307124 RepID=UPI0003701C8C|nr:hypothetical protein [Calidithermus timidus]
MKRIALLILVPALLAAACNRVEPPPPPPPADPPADGPIVWGNAANNPELVFYYFKQAARGLEVTTYIESPDGKQRHQWYGTPDVPESRKLYSEKQSFGFDQGYILHYGQDVTWDKRFGGRKFFWKYGFKIDLERGFPWKFEAPVGPVTFLELDRFPWEERPGLAGKTPRDDAVWSSLNTVPVSGPFISCFQQDSGHYYPKGIYISLWKSASVQGREVGQLDLPPSFTELWSWTNGVYKGMGEARDVLTNHSIGVDSPEIVLNNRTDNWVIYYAAAQGRGPFLHPWEKRLWRVMGRNFGAVEQPDGSVRCEKGDWRVEEVTEPQELVDFYMDLLYRSTNQNPDGLPEGTLIFPPHQPPNWP